MLSDAAPPPTPPEANATIAQSTRAHVVLSTLHDVSHKFVVVLGGLASHRRPERLELLPDLNGQLSAIKAAETGDNSNGNKSTVANSAIERQLRWHCWSGVKS